jgi:acetyl-CoA C-acetyltransferase/acetyl-CoA acyltransferase
MLDVAIVAGVRTPFAKAFGSLADVPAQELGRQVVVAVLQRAEVKPEQIDQTIFGNVATPADAANIARVIALRAGVPEDRIAHTVSRNCASGMEALTTAAQLIRHGDARTILAGGVESMSQIPLIYSPEATERFLRLGKAKGLWQKLRALLRFRPRHFKPIPAVQLGLTDPVSGLVMGETAEVLVSDFGLSRQAQDEYALESHRRAVSAWENGYFRDEVVPVMLPGGKSLSEDVGPRREQTLEALAKLRPIFKKDGTVTVGNSCMVTDGAAGVVLMPGARVRSEGYTPLGYLRAFAYAGCDPRRMGLGPVFATSKLLAQTGLAFRDFDLIELNEAFAAVVLANEQAFASRSFADKHLGRSEPLGELPRDRLNVNGGAIALGHPVGATGTRLVITLLRELRRRGLRRGLATLCVGGGQGAAIVVETE